jgi:Tol biopolymer transport system component
VRKLALRVVGVAAATVLALPPAANPTPPGRNGLIAFVSHTYSGAVGEGLVVIRPDGSGRRTLTHDVRDRSPAWSPDGRLLAFERGGHIYEMRADGKGLKRLGRRATRDHDPAWSPDGRSIAFVTKKSLLVMRADGSGVRRLYRLGDGLVSGPSWSPDGLRIAFSVIDYNLGGGGSILTIGRGGRGLHVVTDGTGDGGNIAQPGEAADADDTDPDWSPDGKQIAVTRLVWLCERCDQNEVFVTNVDGTEDHWVTTDTSFESANPSWSPDGEQLVAQVDSGIAILTLEGTRIRMLDRFASDPAWQPR